METCTTATSRAFPVPTCSPTGWVRFADGMLDGAVVCGSLIGTYEIREREIRIEPGALLTGSCLQRDTLGSGIVDSWPLNDPVLDALGAARTVATRPDGLGLMDSAGRVRILLKPREVRVGPRADV